MRRRLLEWLAHRGIGGFYHYAYFEVTGTERIYGPYRTRSAAEGPTWFARLSFQRQWVCFHLRRPPGALKLPAIRREE